MLDSRDCSGCGETGHIRRHCPKQSYKPPIIRGRGGHGRGLHSRGRGVQGNGVTKSAGVAGKLELLQHNMVGATGRQVIEPIVMLSLGGPRRRHLMLLSQVIFWFVIALPLYCLILDPHFHMYLPHLLQVLIYIVICLTCLFVSLLLLVSL